MTYEFDLIKNILITDPSFTVLEVEEPVNGKCTVLCSMTLSEPPIATIEFYLYNYDGEGDVTEWMNDKVKEYEV